MTASSPRQLIFEVERVQTVKRRIATLQAYCARCQAKADFVDLGELSRTFEVSPAEAVLQLRERRVHMDRTEVGDIIICVESLLQRSDPDQSILTKSLPPMPAEPASNVNPE